MRQIRISDTAIRQLDHIIYYTIDRFGHTQAEKYEVALKSGFALILEHPKIGKKAAHNMRVLHIEQHWIYYSLSEEVVFILAILNEKQSADAFFED